MRSGRRSLKCNGPSRNRWFVGDFAAYFLGLFTEYEWGSQVSLIPTEMFALQQLFCELSLAHSSNMDVAISKFAFAFVAAKSRV